ncbi:putative RNA-directed DNA polymerase from transposon X-element [Trichonephila clavipes]|nr:putative RNA-directed DNA polymerase from transposon X-element [Trichonephila clavipes]
MHQVSQGPGKVCKLQRPAPCKLLGMPQESHQHKIQQKQTDEERLAGVSGCAQENQKTANTFLRGRSLKRHEQLSGCQRSHVTDGPDDIAVEELKECIVDYDPDIIVIQETHLRPADRVSIPNYTCQRSDHTTHRGGGTALFIKNSIRYHAILNVSNTFENSSIIIQIGNNSKITVVCIYRPPHGSINTTELDAILNHSNKAFLFGNFNAKHPSRNPGRANTNDDLDLAVQNFTSSVSNAISASTSTRLINTPHLRLPENIRELNRDKNRFRKLWSNTRYPLHTNVKLMLSLGRSGVKSKIIKTGPGKIFF